MGTSRTIVASPLLLLALLLAFAATAEARVVPELFGEDEFQRTCNQVHFRKMCQSLTRLPRVTTPRELLLASMRVAAEKAREAKSRVDEFAARNHEGRPMESILGACSNGYGNVVQTLEEAREIVATRPAPGTQAQADDMNTKLSAAVTSASDCDNAFADFPEIRSPFLPMQRNVYRLVDNVLNIFVVVNQPEHAHKHGH